MSSNITKYTLNSQEIDVYYSTTIHVCTADVYTYKYTAIGPRNDAKTRSIDGGA